MPAKDEVARVHGPTGQLGVVIDTLHVLADVGRQLKGRRLQTYLSSPFVSVAELARDVEHSLDDLLVTGAAAQVALDALFDLLDRRLRVASQQFPDRHHHPGGAVAALHGVVAGKGCLHGRAHPSSASASIVSTDGAVCFHGRAPCRR